MKKSLFILLLLCLAMPSLADDTVYCPTDQRERAAKCQQAKDKNRQIDETVANWTPMLNDGNMMMYRITRAQNEPNQPRWRHRQGRFPRNRSASTLTNGTDSAVGG